MTQKNVIAEKEEEILTFWDKHTTFEKSLKQTEKGKEFVFYDGPPFATGLPHYGHLLVSVVKDCIPRYKTMKGFHVNRGWGWDCHGLPIENIAEKELGINSKDEIEKIGVKKFNSYCRQKVSTYTEEWKQTIRRIGRWVTYDDEKFSYKTMDKNFMESVWWAFKEMYEKGYVYQGEKILLYCPRCSTPLAKSEIAMDNSYQKVKDISIAVKFKLKGEEHAYAIAWTTTPWTLPSNLALTVNPSLEYSFVKDNKDGNTYLLAKELVETFYQNKEDYTIKKTVLGRELEGIEYEPLFPYFKKHKNAFRILLGDFVTAEEGTGIVHTAPAFGEEDYIVCRNNNIGMIQPVDERGRFTKEVTDFAGKYVHDTNTDIVVFLKKAGKAVYSQKIEHEYPFCYRCDTKLLYRALPAWFIDIQKIKKRMLELNADIQWIPSFLKEGRFKHNVETAPDWNISRNRYWASVIPVWQSQSGKQIVIGSIQELKQYAKNFPKKIDLHKDVIDDIVLEKDGEEYTRVPEVLDCWFESGAMSFAQLHYPFENKDYFEKHFPADYIVEYIAQTRTWFYYMHVLATGLFDTIPFKTVQTTGTILAENGEKMSKSKRNFTDPLELVEKYGADTLRFYFLSSPVMDGEDVRMKDSIIEEIYKKVTLLTYNVAGFYELYKDIEETQEESTELLNQWMLSRTHELCKHVGNYMEEYNTVKACQLLREFIDDLSTWYIRNTRERFTKGDKHAKKTLTQTLDTLSKLLAPIMPLVSERIYHTLYGDKTSVHLQSWPQYDETNIHKDLQKEMKEVREIVSNALRYRDKKQISLKWPLAKAVVTGRETLRPELETILKEQINVKEIEYKKGTELSVELDTTITQELEKEGYTREITRMIQSLRKEAGFVKTDTIHLLVTGEILPIIERHEKEITEKVGAKKILTDTKQTFEYSKEGKIKGKSFLIQLEKI